MPKSEHSKTRNWWVEPPLHQPRLTIRKRPHSNDSDNRVNLIRIAVLYHRKQGNWERAIALAIVFNPMIGASQTAPPSAQTSDLAGWIKLGNVRVHYSYSCSVQLWDACSSRKLQSVGSRGIWNSSARTDSGCFALRPVLYPLNVHFLTFSILALDNLTFCIALHCEVGWPLAVQTSPYFLFNSFASRKSDSNTSPRKHKYASPPVQLYTLYHGTLRRNSDLKWGFPESINMLLPRLCLAWHS